MLTPIQIILVIFIFFASSRVFLRLREKLISPQAAIFWILIWVAAFIGVILPTTTSRIAEFFGIGRGVDIIVYISLALLFYLVFRIYVMIEDVRHEITYLIREIAIQNSPAKRRVKSKKK